MEEDANPYSLSSESDRQAESKEEQGFSRSREESVPGGGGYISKDLELSTSLPGSMSFRRLHDGAGDLSGEVGRASNARLDWGNGKPWEGFEQRRAMVRSGVHKDLCSQRGQ